ncbi:acyltransferase family protein [Acinetobacter rongchengensis]|uniref:Acyltransferase n=1 Tax=Acinetobacter rongchengensis TaxID=2419601 RepID=A0A3A8EZY9_9GAMM|nr:acyltransferase family protein [Acinetobacter rongchengensis]RKG39728.1 acyltransferase [Acinetobacter rongchengensis]
MRDTYLDTSKAVLIFLVVLGHFLERMVGWNDPIAHTLLGTIYFVHMPAFIFISGLLFKDKNWLKNILFFISLYVPFQILFPAFDAIWSGNMQINRNLFERPYWILWYLLGMMVWTLLTHFLIKTKFAVWIALILALCVGLSPWNNYQYSVGRIFTFLPFFVIGAVYGKAIIQSIRSIRYAEWFGVLIFIGIFSLVYLSQINQFWLYGSLSYQQLKVSAFEGTLIRLGCMAVSSLGIFAIFAIVKQCQSRFLKLGINTLPVYLLHGFVVILISKYWKLESHILIELMICFGLSLLTCWILQQQSFDMLLRKMSLWLMKPVERLGLK